MPLTPTEQEIHRRNEVINRLLDHIREDVRIKLPDFDPSKERPSDLYALINVGIEPNQFSGTIGRFRYQFEGEEDLLHLIVTSQDAAGLSTAEGHEVGSFVLQGVPTALIWLRPGSLSQHFYVGHDELIKHLAPEWQPDK